VAVITLRPVADADLDALFDQMRDPESVRMAAFTPGDPDDRTAFDAHMTEVRSQKSGFKIIGTENSFAPGRNCVIKETILRRD
jgi:hypothetical protein